VVSNRLKVNCRFATGAATCRPFLREREISHGIHRGLSHGMKALFPLEPDSLLTGDEYKTHNTCVCQSLFCGFSFMDEILDLD